ncbi:putative transposase [Bradyrhizobium liaoningense]
MATDFSPEILDQLLAGGSLKPEDLAGEDGLFRRLKKALLERALGAELTHHLGYEKGDPAGRGSGNSRNGTSSKALLRDDGEIEIEVPRDRAGTFEPVIVAKGQTRFDGFDEKIISLYGRGMTVREIQGHLAELYGTEVSPDLISKVTDAILDEVREWQSRPLEAIYPVVFFDALRVKIRDEGMVKNKAVYVVLGITASGEKDVLGLWIEQTEGAKFWLKVMNDLRNRGVADILIAVVDGLKGFPEAINSVFPKAMVQTCIVHLIRNSLSFVSWKDRKAILPSIKAIYHAENADAALLRLEDFEAEWGKRYPAIGAAWRRAWEHVIPFFAFAPEIRKMIYTTNTVEALNRSLRKIIKTRGELPQRRGGDEAALPRHQKCRHPLATTGCMDGRNGPVCHPVSYAGFWVTRRSGGVVFRHLDDLDAVFESDTCADLRQLICAFQPPPGL